MSSLYWVQYPSSNVDRFLISPIQLTVGYQISPRVAVQIGISGRRLKESNLAIGTDSVRNVVTEGSQSTRKFLEVPVVAKYTFSNLGKKLQFYWLGGFSFVFARTSSTFTNTNGQEITRHQSYRKHTTDVFVCLALEASYRFSKQWEMNVEVGVNKNMSHLKTPRIPLGSSRGIGVSYAFR